MGWNDLDVKKKDSILFNGSKDPKVVYFVHSYHLVPDERVNGQISSISYHGTEVTASIEKDNIFGTQFHPEKSQNFGLLILKNFLNLC